MNISPVKSGKAAIDFSVVIDNLTLLSKIDPFTYLWVNAETKKMHVTWSFWGSAQSKIVKVILETFDEAIKNQEAPRIKKLYEATYNKLFRSNENYRYIDESARGKFNKQWRLHDKVNQAQLVVQSSFFGRNTTKNPRLISVYIKDFNKTRNDVRDELNKVEKMLPELKAVCSEIKHSVPKDAPSTHADLNEMQKRLWDARSKLKKVKKDPVIVNSPVPKKIRFVPSPTELADKKSSLKKPESLPIIEIKDSFRDEIQSKRGGLNKTGMIEKLMKKESLFELSIRQRKAYDLDSLAPCERVERILNGLLNRIPEFRKKIIELNLETSSSETSSGDEWFDIDGLSDLSDEAFELNSDP